MVSRLSQLSILLKKQILVSRRSIAITFFTIIVAPLVFVILLTAMVNVFDGWFTDRAAFGTATPHGTNSSIPSVGDITCFDPSSCKKLAYAPTNNANIDLIISKMISSDQGLDSSDVEGFASKEAFDSYILGIDRNVHPFAAAVMFDTVTAPYSYTIRWPSTNYTCFLEGFSFVCPDVELDLQLPLINALDQAIAQVRLDDDTYSIIHDTIISYPHPPLVVTAPVSFLTPTFLFLTMSVLLMLFAIQAVEEGVKGHRAVFEVVGVSHMVYWSHWAIVFSVLGTGTSLFTWFLFWVMDYDMVRLNPFWPVFLTLVIYMLSCVATAILVALFSRSTQTAAVIGFTHMFVFMMASSLADPLVFNEDVSRGVQWLCSVVPPLSFNHAITVITAASTMVKRTGMGDGVTLSDDSSVFDLGSTWIGMIAGSIIITLPVIITGIVKRNPRAPPTQADDPKIVELESRDEQDVIQARIDAERAVDPAESSEFPLVLHRVCKRFQKAFKDPFWAVSDVSLSVQHGTLLGLLGPNGAGKTTTISMLTGQLNPTAGRVRLLGKNLFARDAPRSQVGFCPQHDITWPRLSSAEHIKLFTALRGITDPELVAKEVEIRLAGVDLLAEADRQVRSFSGGMRRRLSLAVALTGSPAVLLLDEPTTGLDPKVRRQVWKTIREASSDSAVVLTTHSMEEAEALSDIIAIVAAGRTRVIGSSIELKSRLGGGYNLTVRHSSPIPETVSALVQACPDSVQTSDGSKSDQISWFIRDIASLASAVSICESESAKEEGVVSQTITLTTLEDVFLRVARSIHRDLIGLPIVIHEEQELQLEE